MNRIGGKKYDFDAVKQRRKKNKSSMKKLFLA